MFDLITKKHKRKKKNQHSLIDWMLWSHILFYNGALRNVNSSAKGGVFINNSQSPIFLSQSCVPWTCWVVPQMSEQYSDQMWGRSRRNCQVQMEERCLSAGRPGYFQPEVRLYKSELRWRGFRALTTRAACCRLQMHLKFRVKSTIWRGTLIISAFKI